MDHHPRLLEPHELAALHTDAIVTSEACKRLIEIRRLRCALQRIADLPLAAPEIRARRIAVAALGGDPQHIHLNQ